MNHDICGNDAVRRYGEIGTWGGAAIGALIAAILGGPHLDSWESPVASYALCILAGAAIGAVVGYLCGRVCFHDTGVDHHDFGDSRHRSAERATCDNSIEMGSSFDCDD